MINIHFLYLYCMLTLWKTRCKHMIPSATHCSSLLSVVATNTMTKNSLGGKGLFLFTLPGPRLSVQELGKNRGGMLLAGSQYLSHSQQFSF